MLLSALQALNVRFWTFQQKLLIIRSAVQILSYGPKRSFQTFKVHWLNILFCGIQVCYLTIIPQGGRVGYEMIDRQRGA